jgi:type IV pilus assembly protein PilA
MKNYLDACKRRKEETGESGFSLIELIVVVVILGILAAIAVPVFLGLQENAKKSAVETASANGASQVAADFAAGTKTAAVIGADVAKMSDGDIVVSLKSGTSIEDFCVLAKNGDIESTSGPCPAG